MQTPREFAADILGCTREVVEPGRTSSGQRYCGEHYYGWLADVGMCPVQERLAKAIRARDAEVLREAAEDFANGGWNDAWMTDPVDDDVSAVLSTEKWLLRRAEAIEGGGRP